MFPHFTVLCMKGLKTRKQKRNWKKIGYWHKSSHGLYKKTPSTQEILDNDFGHIHERGKQRTEKN